MVNALIRFPGQRKPTKIRNIKGSFSHKGMRYESPRHNEITVIPSIFGDKEYAFYVVGIPRPIPVTGVEYVEQITEKDVQIREGGEIKTKKEKVAQLVARPFKAEPDSLTASQNESHYGKTPARVLREAFQPDNDWLKWMGLVAAGLALLSLIGIGYADYMLHELWKFAHPQQ